MDELHNELRLKSDKQRHQVIKRYVGGLCTRCYNIPMKKIIYDIGDAKLIERYCNSCFNDSIRQDGRRKKDIDKLN